MQIDYSDRKNWLYYAVGENKKADAFIICPSVSSDPRCVNIDENDNPTRMGMKVALNMQCGIYADELRLFAPFYRQTTLGAYCAEESEREPRLEFAYKDLRRAFIHYLTYFNDGRAFVLTGYSQGADMVKRLIKEFFGKNKLREKFIAAYLYGWHISPDEIETFHGVTPAQSETDTGVLVTFTCEAPGTLTSVSVKTKTVSINPFNWKTDSSTADKSLNKGAVMFDIVGNVVGEYPALTGGYLDKLRGTLKITDVKKEDYPWDSPLYLGLFQMGDYHLLDYQFTYRNLQENVRKRIEAYFEKIKQ